MPFGVVSGVWLGMGVLDRGGDRRREGTVLEVNLGRPIVTNGALATRSSQINLRTCCCCSGVSSAHAVDKCGPSLHTSQLAWSVSLCHQHTDELCKNG